MQLTLTHTHSKYIPRSSLMIKYFAELGQFIRPLTSNLPDKVSVSNLMRHSMVALILLHSVLQQKLSQFPVPALWATSQMALSKLQVATSTFSRCSPTAASPSSRGTSGTAKRHLSQRHTVKAEIPVLSCVLLISSRWTNLLDSSLFLPDLDMSSEPSHFSLSLEPVSGGLCTCTDYRSQEWTGLNFSAPEGAWG